MHMYIKTNGSDLSTRSNKWLMEAYETNGEEVEDCD